VAPRWELTVVDEHGEPVPKLVVVQGWHDRTAMGDPLERSYWTDERGRVTLARRWAWASTTERLVRYGWLAGGRQVDGARADAHAYVWEPGYRPNLVVYSRARPGPRLLVAQYDDCMTKPVLGRAARLRHFGPSGAGSRCLPGATSGAAPGIARSIRRRGGG